MSKLFSTVFACWCLMLFCSPLMASYIEAEHNVDLPKDDDKKLINWGEVKQSIVELINETKQAWEEFKPSLKLGAGSEDDQAAEAQGNFLVVALNVLRGFKHHLEEKLKLKEGDLDDGDGRPKVRRPNLFDRISRRISDSLESVKKDLETRESRFGASEDGEELLLHDLFLSNEASQESETDNGDKTDEEDGLSADSEESNDEGSEERSDESIVEKSSGEESIVKPVENKPTRMTREIARTKSYDEYCAFVKKHNKELELKTMAAIKQKTNEFLKNIILDEIRALGLILLEQTLTKGAAKVDVQAKAQLIQQLKLNIIKFVSLVFSEALVLIFTRMSPRDHPDAPRAKFPFEDLFKRAEKEVDE